MHNARLFYKDFSIEHFVVILFRSLELIMKLLLIHF